MHLTFINEKQRDETNGMRYYCTPINVKYREDFAETQEELNAGKQTTIRRETVGILILCNYWLLRIRHESSPWNTVKGP